MSRTARRLLGLALLATSIVLLPLEGPRAWADTTTDAETVVLLQPATASLSVRRSLARIGDELSADRFHVVVADPGTAGDPGAVIESATRAAEAPTVLVLFGDPETGQAELCIVWRGDRRTAVRRATVVVDDPERMPEALARRAGELLRATALELSISIGPAPAAETPQRSEADLRPSVSASAAPSPIVIVDVGVGMWNSVDGPPPAVAPVGRVGLRLSDWAWARLTLSGWGSRPRVDTAYGSAALSQNMALIECAAIFRNEKRVRPMLSVGAGALYVAAAGTGASPYEGREPRQWSAAFAGGAGVAVAVGARAALVTELHAVLASPHPVVRFVDARAATVGYPSLILTLALRVAP